MSPLLALSGDDLVCCCKFWWVGGHGCCYRGDEDRGTKCENEQNKKKNDKKILAFD